MEKIDEIKSELRDRFGPPPPSAENVLKLMEFRARAINVGLDRVETGVDGLLRARFAPGNIPGRQILASIAEKFSGRLTFHTDNGFSLSVKQVEAGDDVKKEEEVSSLWNKSMGVGDLESLLNLLEFYAK